MSNNDILLEVKHLSKKFADNEPLKDVNCSVRQGERKKYFEFEMKIIFR